ncbi:MAG: SDR family NAD(P)-dependent oxidoreductase, partial [Rhizobiales bacterium]|nr:SDR family NAD(P)-dependent oxidoreductase [Hyphomicrobiales bacterium]
MGLLEGKVVLVTGGTSGIGEASARLFAREGARVALTGRRAAEGNAVVSAIEAEGGSALFVQADLAEVDGIPAFVEQVVARFGRL